MTLPELARQSVTDYIVNSEFTEASLFFKDGSFLQFVHKSRDQRWARPSADDTMAGQVCQEMTSVYFTFFVDWMRLNFSGKAIYEYQGKKYGQQAQGVFSGQYTGKHR